MSSDNEKIPLVLTPQMRERIDRLANPDDATHILIEQVEAEIGQGQKKGKTK